MPSKPEAATIIHRDTREAAGFGAAPGPAGARAEAQTRQTFPEWKRELEAVAGLLRRGRAFARAPEDGDYFRGKAGRLSGVGRGRRDGVARYPSRPNLGFADGTRGNSIFFFDDPSTGHAARRPNGPRREECFDGELKGCLLPGVESPTTGAGWKKLAKFVGRVVG